MGGLVVFKSMGGFSQGFFSYSNALMSRKAPLPAPGLPASPYIENAGVRPDIEGDYMTRANLEQQGRPFIQAFVQAMIAHIDGSK
jgi:hypothetical protein